MAFLTIHSCAAIVTIGLRVNTTMETGLTPAARVLLSDMDAAVTVCRSGPTPEKDEFDSRDKVCDYTSKAIKWEGGNYLFSHEADFQETCRDFGDSVMR